MVGYSADSGPKSEDNKIVWSLGGSLHGGVNTMLGTLCLPNAMLVDDYATWEFLFHASNNPK